MLCRTATITTLANLVYTHDVDKVTHSGRITIEGFTGSVSLNIQPILMNSLVQSDEWVAVVRDKVLRYYHLYRPLEPQQYAPQVEIDWGLPINMIYMSARRGKLFHQLVWIGLTQWSYARVREHIPDLLKASASLDGRDKVDNSDYRFLKKLLLPMRLEPQIIKSFGFEAGRVFNNNLYCILVELASFGNPSLEQVSVDYKVNDATARRLIQGEPEWAWIKSNSPSRVMPTKATEEILEIAGVKQKW